MAFHKLLDDKRRLLFTTSLFVTVGGWVLTLPNWHAAIRTGAFGGLLVLLGNGVFANMIKNVGILGTGVTNESDPTTQLPSTQATQEKP